MTQEEKQTIIKDLLPRIQYGVKAKITGYHEEIVYGGYASDVEDISDEVLCLNEDTFQNLSWFLNDEEVTSIKTYLRPMSSMTEEEIKKYEKTTEYEHMECYNVRANCEDRRVIIFQDAYSSAMDLDWLISNHFDYLGLIPRGLALEAPEGMYQNLEI